VVQGQVLDKVLPSQAWLQCENHRSYQSKASGVFGFNPEVWQTTSGQGEFAIPAEVHQSRRDNSNAFRYVDAFRKHGYKYADLNPVALSATSLSSAAELDIARYGLSPAQTVPTNGLCSSDAEAVSVTELTEQLAKVYCGSTALECGYLECENEQEWLFSEYENIKNQPLEDSVKKSLAFEMLKSQAFDNFLATKFQSVKRYGGEGAEAMMGFFTELFNQAERQNIDQVILGQAHRGRLNLLTGLLQYPPVAMFRKMKGLPEFPPEQSGAGDVLSHLTASLEIGSVHVTMLPNPSHLEAVNPVAVGKTRAKHLTVSGGEYGDGKMGDNALCVQIHGDAAVAGQGINMETLQIANVPHYSVGGSLHLVVNNQVGFTTPGERGRSSRHCTDLAKQIGAPVIHVNGDHPEDLVRATRLAMEYRQKFRKDIFVNLVCFRRWGHNELDDPTFTNPALYSVIHARRSVPDNYSDKLIENGIISKEERSAVVSKHMEILNENFRMMDTYKPERINLKGLWQSVSEPSANITEWDTGVSADVLKFVGSKSVQAPEDFNVHSHLKKHHIEGRIKKLESGAGIDWGTAEALAMGSLLYQGFNIRISGQDVGRATFSHRHAMLVDQESNEIYIPMNDIMENQEGKLEIANSILSEEAVLAFEYGMSVESPNNLIIWEAQFGDFFNGAQIILDTYIANGESKWGLQSGLVMMLPHGMDGAGPEHSSCRIERFLQMTDSKESSADGDNVNWEVVHPTTAAQHFHLLRRQMVRNYRKPLVIIAPKTLLRLPAAASTLAEMSPGKCFQTVLSDTNVPAPEKVEKVVFVSGKHYFTLSKYIQENSVQNVAVVRLESICPFPAERLQQELKKFKNAKKFVWSQEEHRNMGCWSFIQPRFENLVGVKLSYAGRGELCQPAVGVGQVHQAENKQILDETFS